MKTKHEMRQEAIKRLNEMYKAGPYTTKDVVIALAGSSGWVGRIIDLLIDDDGLTEDDYLELLKDAAVDYRLAAISGDRWRHLCIEFERAYIALPRDANDEVIYIGDRVVEHEDGHDFIVDGYEYDGEWWVFHRDGVRAPANMCTHYDVEDVLNELVRKIYEHAWNDGKEGVRYDGFEDLVKVYAERLRLKEGEDE